MKVAVLWTQTTGARDVCQGIYQVERKRQSKYIDLPYPMNEGTKKTNYKLQTGKLAPSEPHISIKQEPSDEKRDTSRTESAVDAESDRGGDGKLPKML